MGVMENILDRDSTVFVLKSKFFLFRVIGYFSFLFIPIYAQKYFNSTPWLKFVMMLFYLLFLISQWFLVGKEIDHRLKIFFKVNSNMDRVLYRTITGLIVFIFYANLISLFPHKWIYNFYWITWTVIGVFFSWPTRGKIIRESVTSNFTEFKFLDSFERTTLVLTMIMVIFSIPKIQNLTSIIKFMHYFDPSSSFSPMLWNFLKVSFYPFTVRPELFLIALNMHFYFVFQVLFLLTFYALLRFFFSRRLSLLGIFALVSSWGYAVILYKEPGSSLSMTFSLIWVWSMLWVARSSTYKTGLFLSLVNCLGVIVNPHFAFLILLQIPLFLWVFFKPETKWFRRQFLKYSMFGYVLSLGILFFHHKYGVPNLGTSVLNEILFHFRKKAFLILSFLGVLILIIKSFKSKRGIFHDFYFDQSRLVEMMFFSLIFFLLNFFWIGLGATSFLIVCLLIFLSLIPLELLFQKTSRLRSSRNMIFVIYVLICLLDSHLEERIKIFLKLFE
jgi:hypothetical protein